MVRKHHPLTLPSSDEPQSLVVPIDHISDYTSVEILVLTSTSSALGEVNTYRVTVGLVILVYVMKQRRSVPGTTHGPRRAEITMFIWLPW